MRISHLFILLAASAMLTACDFLDEYNPNSVTVGNYYTSEEDIVASLNGVYTSLTQSYVADNYHYFTDVRANATVVTNSGANSGIPYQFYNYTLTEENVYVYNRYSQLYKIISRANTLFAHLGDVSYATPSARDTYEAAARFLPTAVRLFSLRASEAFSPNGLYYNFFIKPEPFDLLFRLYR